MDESGGIDLTRSVLADRATERAMEFVSGLYADYQPDIVETAIERALLEIRATKSRLYAEALMDRLNGKSADAPDSETKSGTVDDLKEDLRRKGIAVAMD